MRVSSPSSPRYRLASLIAFRKTSRSTKTSWIVSGTYSARTTFFLAVTGLTAIILPPTRKLWIWFGATYRRKAPLPQRSISGETRLRHTDGVLEIQISQPSNTSQHIGVLLGRRKLLRFQSVRSRTFHSRFRAKTLLRFSQPFWEKGILKFTFCDEPGRRAMPAQS